MGQSGRPQWAILVEATVKQAKGESESAVEAAGVTACKGNAAAATEGQAGEAEHVSVLTDFLRVLGRKLT